MPAGGDIYMVFTYALACIIAFEIFKAIKWFKKENKLNIYQNRN